MKIKLLEINDIELLRNKRLENNITRIILRNRRTFVPYLYFQKYLENYDVFFTNSRKDADVYFISWGSVFNQSLNYSESISSGVEVLKSLDKPFYFFDTNDTVSLHGIFDVFKNCPGVKYLKSHYYKNLDEYLNEYTYGREWWNKDNKDNLYKLNVNELNLLKNKIDLSYTSWMYSDVSIFNKNISLIKSKKNKDDYDVICLVGIKKIENCFNKDYASYYNDIRVKTLNKLEDLKKYNFKILTSQNTGKLKTEEYISKCISSKIMISPNGFGEINTRELDAIKYGNILFKQDFSKIKTSPDLFNDNTCFFFDNNLENFEEKLVDAINNYDSYVYKVENIRNKLIKEIENLPKNILKIV